MWTTTVHFKTCNNDVYAWRTVAVYVLQPTPVFFNLFAAAEPLANVDVAHGTPGPDLASARPNATPRHGAPVSWGAMMSLRSAYRGTTFS